MARTSYLIALGSNRRGRHGAPERELAAALVELRPIAASPIVTSAPVGPSHRRYANAVALIESEEMPPELLARLKRIEREFGRRSGRRWGARVLDLDIILWSEGPWVSQGLVIPHVEFRNRTFVLGPLLTLVPDWRDPITGRTIRQLAYPLRARG